MVGGEDGKHKEGPKIKIEKKESETRVIESK